MKEVKSPKKPLIYYYGLVMLIILLFNLFISPLLLKGQVTEVDYGHLYEDDRGEEHRQRADRELADPVHRQGRDQDL